MEMAFLPVGVSDVLISDLLENIHARTLKRPIFLGGRAR